MVTKCEVIKKGKTQGGEGVEFYAIVRLANEKGESLEFCCRNVFDVGYVINPNYRVAPNIEEGGIVIGGKWYDFDSSKGGWYAVRELTKFEKECLDYLHKNPPVFTDIRL